MIGKTMQETEGHYRQSCNLQPDPDRALAKLFGVSVDSLVGEVPPKPRGNGPAGKMRQLFDAASRLPRSQQQKIAAVLEPFVREHAVAR